MPDDITIQSIKISATADTSAATSALNSLAAALEKVKAAAGGNLASAISAISELTRAVNSLSSANVSGFATQMDKLAVAFERITKVNFDTAKVSLAIKALKAQTREAEVAARGAKNAAELKVKADKIEASRERAKILAQSAATAAAKEARLSNKVTGEPDEERKSAKSSKADTQEEKFKKKDAAAAYKEANRQWKMAAAEVAKNREEIAKQTAKINEEYQKWANSSAFYDNAKKLGESLKKHLASGAKHAATALGSMMKNMAIAPFKHLITSIKDITFRLSHFLAALKRIAVYRAIRAALKELTQAFREGIENLYQYSKELNGTFAQSMDTLATAALYAKNSLAAMASPIINILAPAVDYAVDRFVEFLNVVNELIASLTGAETWTRALKYPKEYAEAMDGANGSAKKLRATLLGFDEINRLDDNSKGRRGSAAEELDYSKMFTTETVNTATGGVIKAIKDAFEEGDFSEIGKSIGEKLKKGLDKIPWASIKDRVTKNAASVATLINGFIDTPNLGETLGKTIAEVFNVAVDKVSMFYNTVNWKNIGTFLGDGFNSLLTTFNFRELARTLAKIINSGVDLISGFISTVDWSEFATFLADGINGFFTDLEIDKLGETISNIITRALGAVHTFFKETDFQKLGEKVGEFLSKIDWKEIFSGLSQVFFDALGAAFEGLVGLIKESPVFGTLAAIAVANKISTAFAMPKITSILGTALSKWVTGGAASATAGAVASGGTASLTGAAGAAAGLGSASALATAGILSVFIAGIATTAAVSWWKEKEVAESLGELEPYAGYLEDVKKYGYGQTPYDINNELEFFQKDIQENLAKIKANTDSMLTQEKSIKDKVEIIRIEAQSIKASTASMDTSFKSDPKTITRLKGYASGGMPETGSVFLAGERGAELISSGRSGTQVANRDQISASVANGMTYANEEQNALLREQNNLLRELVAKDTNVVAQITTGQLTSALNRANQRSGSTIVPVY